MKLIKAEPSVRLDNLYLPEYGFCHRPIAAGDILAAGDPYDGSASIARDCYRDQLTKTQCCDLPDSPPPHGRRFLGAKSGREARLGADFNATCFDDAMSVATQDLDLSLEACLPGQYRDHQILEYAEYPPPEYWLPEVAAAAQQAESEDKRFMWVTWPDGVQVNLATDENPTADVLVHAYRKAAALMTHHVSGLEAQS